VNFIVHLTSFAFATVTLVGCASKPIDVKPPPEAKLRRIGFVAGAGGFEKMAVTNRTFFDALGEFGYVHGKTMEVVFRTAEGDMAKMPSLVDDVLKNDVEILVVSSSPGCAAAKAATTSTPVLCISVQDDPIKAGLTSTLSNPQSNVIGVYSFLPTGISQQLDWIGRFVPKLSTLGVLYNPQNATHVRLLTEWTSVAMEKGVHLVPMPVTRAEDLDGAITRALDEKAQIGIGLLGPDTYAIRKEIAENARARRFPIVMDTPGGYADMGGVATVGVNIVPFYRRGAVEQMIPMLRGRRPSDLSWIGPTQVDVVVNEEAARSFGLIVPLVTK
jgi:ABC-type uncharacterized transport system substrate-binding protein